MGSAKIGKEPAKYNNYLNPKGKISNDFPG